MQRATRIANGALVLFLAGIPYVSYAATPKTFAELVDRLVLAMNQLLPILIGIALAFFMFRMLGAFGIFGEGGKGAFDKEKFKTSALWGIGILFVMVSIWGILRLLEDTLEGNYYGSAGSQTENCTRYGEC